MLQYEGCVYTIHIHHVYLTWRWNVHVQLLYTSLAVNVLRLLYSRGKLPNVLTPKATSFMMALKFEGNTMAELVIIPGGPIKTILPDKCVVGVITFELIYKYSVTNI